MDTKTHFERIKELLGIAKRIAPDGEEIEGIFVEDFIEENRRVFKHVEFFTKHCCLSSENFMSGSNIGVIRLKGNLWNSELTFKDYDFVKASDVSRLRISSRVSTSGTLVFSLNATGKNCDFLLGIYKKYFTLGGDE